MSIGNTRAEGLTMGAERKRQPKARWLGIHHITADMKTVQSRAAMSKEDEREFGLVMRERGFDPFPEVVVFYDGKKYWLADGFHRYFAAKAAGLSDIKVDIRDGSKRDAVIHSAGANLKFSIKRTTQDKKRSVKLVLAEPDWNIKADQVIGVHCGVASSFVKNCRIEFRDETGTPIPDRVQTSDGRNTPSRLSQRPRIYTVKPKLPTHSEQFKTIIDDRQVDLGRDRDAAEQAVAQHHKESHDQAQLRRSSLSYSCIESKLNTNGIVASSAQSETTRRYRNTISLAGLKGKDWVGISCSFTEFDSIDAAIGRIVCLKGAHPGALRAIVFCYRDNAPDGLFKLAEWAGIEFMTPEEFVASVKAAEQGEPTP